MIALKFRAWDKKQKIMVDDFCIGRSGEIFNVAVCSYGCGDGIFKIEGLEVMQYTGLQDKSGKEIYEGDIVNIESSKNHVSKWEVKFEEGAFNIANLMHFGMKTEVIGNIYENPELLK